MSIKKIAVFASGRGSNLEALLRGQQESSYQISLVIVSKEKAHALEIARINKIAFLVLDKPRFTDTTELLSTLNSYKIDFICLAGFLWKIPSYLIKSFPDRIVNIHPSLLPKFGGKGMYGMKVHEAVIAQKETVSGITIHLVNEEYDKGRVLFQKKIDVLENESAASLAARILILEHTYFPMVVRDLCNAEK